MKREVSQGGCVHSAEDEVSAVVAAVGKKKTKEGGEGQGLWVYVGC